MTLPPPWSGRATSASMASRRFTLRNCPSSMPPLRPPMRRSIPRARSSPRARPRTRARRAGRADARRRGQGRGVAHARARRESRVTAATRVRSPVLLRGPCHPSRHNHDIGISLKADLAHTRLDARPLKLARDLRPIQRDAELGVREDQLLVNAEDRPQPPALQLTDQAIGHGDRSLVLRSDMPSPECSQRTQALRSARAARACRRRATAARAARSDADR